MVQIIPRNKNFGDLLAQGIGQGFTQGMSQASNFASQLGLERQKNSMRQKLISEVEGQNGSSNQQSSSQNFEKQFLDALPEIENQIGRELTPQDLDTIWGQLTQGQGNVQQSGQDPFAKAKKYAAVGEHDLSRLSSEEAKLGYKKEADLSNRSFGETKDYRDSLSTQARGAKDLEPVLSQMEHLISKGKLSNPIIAKLADSFGLVGLLDPNSQQFQALSVGFLKDAKNLFGSRVTNFDLETYLDKIPRLTQTDKGKKVLIDNFRTLGEASQVKNKIKNQIIKENKGVPPLDLEDIVNERAQPELDKLAEKFNKSFINSSRSKSGKIRMRNPDGTLGEVSEDRVQEAITKGYSLE